MIKIGNNIIKIGNYIINYMADDNKIEISLPQTESTCKSTIANYENRKINVTDQDLLLILGQVISVFNGKD